MKIKSSILILIFIFINVYFNSAAKDVEKCESCDNLVKNFIKNFDKTSKGNFGGGNTDWEDRKLGNYLTSETRFEEIIENICDDSSCHSALEEYEDYLFDWFKNKQKIIKKHLYYEFCINTLKSCCPENTFGKSCDKCPQNLNKTCSGNGKCDGDGTRKGDGKCKCNEGYTGSLCEICKSGYYAESTSDNSISCKECHKACKSTCIKNGPDGCVDCKDGWLFEDGKCEDINECEADDSICKEDQYCLNNEGSYNCFNCNSACKKCTSSGAENCVECNNGYEKDSNNVCVDINECERDINICNGNECINKNGSYECKGADINDDNKSFLFNNTILIGLFTLIAIRIYNTKYFIFIIFLIVLVLVNLFYKKYQL